MSTFYFHFRQGPDLTKDQQGSEFDTVENAYLSAFRAAQDMWRDLLVERQDPRRCSFEVNDTDEQLLFVLPFSEVLDVCTDTGAPKRPTSMQESLRNALAHQRRAQKVGDEMSDQLDTFRRSVAESMALLRKFG
jgi:hypothetical protein